MEHNPEKEAANAHHVNTGVLIGLTIFCVLYLGAALLGLPHLLVVVGAVGAFIFGLAYMGTMIWVYSLRSERKRASKRGKG